MRAAIFTVTAVAVSLLVWHCGHRDNPDYEIGGLYSVRDSETGFRVAKVLALDPGAISVRLYKQTFPTRPETVNPSQLTLGSIDDSDGFGVGHLPLDFATFASWQPALVLRTAVTDDELDGYRAWRESGGGTFR